MWETKHLRLASVGSAGDASVDLISVEAAGSVPGLFLERMKRSPDAVAFREFDRVTGRWRSLTWRETGHRVAQFQQALVNEGLKPGEHVAILLANSIDWIAFDIAAMGCGLVVVPLYPHDSVENAVSILGHCKAKLLFTDNWARWQQLSARQSEFSNIEGVWIQSPATEAAGLQGAALARPLTDVLPSSAKAGDLVNIAAPRSLATLIYTSGTTGRPKGAMLSHFALLWNAAASARLIPPRRDDVFLSFLPLAHAFERTAGYTMAMMGGSVVSFARSIDLLRADFRLVRPTAVVAVPRVFELIHATIRLRIARSPLRQRVFDYAAALGWRKFEVEQGRARPLGLMQLVLWFVLGQLFSRSVLRALGGRLRVAVSGGASLGKEIQRTLIGLGLPIVEGYGLTEAAPVVCSNTLEDNLPGSVGRPLPGVSLMVSDTGELLVQTPSIMVGYWKDEMSTAQAIDLDGWLHTGDLAEIRNGRVFIRGRLKEVIVLATGEKVGPGDIEEEVKRNSVFQQALVVGEGRPWLAAVVVLDASKWKVHAERLGLDASEPNEGAAAAEILRLVRMQLSDRPRHLQIHFVYATQTPWTIQAGLLTPTLKVKRKPVERLFQDEIAALYKEHSITG
jgi:long-chain acyl-CoA synthetase